MEVFLDILNFVLGVGFIVGMVYAIRWIWRAIKKPLKKKQKTEVKLDSYAAEKPLKKEQQAKTKPDPYSVAESRPYDDNQLITYNSTNSFLIGEDKFENIKIYQPFNYFGYLLGYMSLYNSNADLYISFKKVGDQPLLVFSYLQKNMKPRKSDEIKLLMKDKENDRSILSFTLDSNPIRFEKDSEGVIVGNHIPIDTDTLNMFANNGIDQIRVDLKSEERSEDFQLTDRDSKQFQVFTKNFKHLISNY